MASNIPSGDYLSRYYYPSYEYPAPSYNYYGEAANNILPYSPSSNGKLSTIIFWLINWLT